MNEIDLRLLRAAVAVAEEVSFSRAAIRLHISQPALTKQIQDLESLLNIVLFERDRQRVIVTEAGSAFVAEAQLALLHQQRAVHAARSVVNGADMVLNLGQSPYIDPLLSSIVSSVHLPLYPKLRIHLFSDYSPDLTRRVTNGELDLAVVTAGDDSRHLTSVELSRSSLYVVLDRHSELAKLREITLNDLDGVPWILFPHHVHPFLYDAIDERAIAVGVCTPERHHVTSAEQAAQLVQSTGGVAFLNKCGAWKVAMDGLTMRPLIEPEFMVRTVLAARNDAGRIVSEFLRAAVRKVREISAPVQGALSLTA